MNFFRKKQSASFPLPFFISVILLTGWPFWASAAETAASSHATALVFLWIAIILLIAKTSRLIERLGQTAVLGELIVGVIIGNLFLWGVPIFEPLRADPFIAFLAQLGVVILMFQIGLASNIREMKRVGLRAFLVACIGVITPFFLGTYVVGPWLLPNLSFNTYLFLGAILTATSVGITARIFKDLNALRTKEAQIVLGAAVIDDVLGLIILAVVAALAAAGTVSAGSVLFIAGKALIFLAVAIIGGQMTAPFLGRTLSKIHTGIGMKFTLAISFGLLLAYFADLVGLAPIVGAFAAGLILDPVHFKYFKDPQITTDIQKAIVTEPPTVKEKINKIIEVHTKEHVDRLMISVGHLLVPIFFVMSGFQVRLDALLSIPLLMVALGFTVAAIVGKVISGVVAGRVNKIVVGFGMVPRGEVGLIFVMMGKSLGVINEQVFSVMVMVIIFTTLLTPIIMTALLKRTKLTPSLVEA